MAKVSRSDWVAWKSHPVTEAFMEDMLKEADGRIGNLVNFAGKDSSYDRYICGEIAGMKWIVDWEPDIYEPEDEIEEEDDEYA